MSLPSVSVIIPGHNCSHTLEACLDALRQQDYPSEKLELIYVDDASSDDSFQKADGQVDLALRLVQGPCGPALARNRGAAAARGQILLFVDSDVVVRPNTVRSVVEALSQEPDVAAIFGSYDPSPPGFSLISDYRNLLHHYFHQVSSPEAKTFWAGCGAVYREVFEKVGGFRPRFPVEDIELGYRLRRHGYRIRLHRHIQVTHLKRWTFGTMIRTDLLTRGIPWVRLILQYQQLGSCVGNLNLTLAAITSVPLVWLGLLAFLGSWWRDELLLGSACFFGTVILLNWRVHRFFFYLRGLRFGVCVLPLLLLYHLLNGAAVTAGVLSWIAQEGPRMGRKT